MGAHLNLIELGVVGVTRRDLVVELLRVLVLANGVWHLVNNALGIAESY